MNTVSDLIARSRLEIRRNLSPYPSVFLPLMRLRRGHRGHVIDDQTEIVIEGFPRSGNTFAVAAFEFAQSRSIHVARHLHAAAHVLAGIRRGLPVMMVCREPESAALSLVIRHPEMTLRMALHQYVSFHEPLLDQLGSIVVAPFEVVTSDFGAVIDQLNAKFGTSYSRFHHTPHNVERVFEQVDLMERQDATRRANDPVHTVGRPMADRDRRKAALQERLSDPRLDKVRNRARLLHERFVSSP